MTFRTSSLLAAVLAALLPLPAQAHRGWLIPTVAEVSGKEPWVTVQAAISEDLYVIDHVPLALDRLRITGPDGRTFAPEKIHAARQFSAADIKLPGSGTYRIALVGESAMASYRLNGESKRWRGPAEALEKEIPAHAEDLQVSTTLSRMQTWVTADKASPPADQPEGKGLEIQPLDTPTGLLAGQTTRFRLLLDGKPLPGLTLAVVPGGVRYRGILGEIAVSTDARGEFAVKWPQPQMYWISASYPPRAPATAEGQPRPAQPARRFSVSASVEVLPE